MSKYPKIIFMLVLLLGLPTLTQNCSKISVAEVPQNSESQPSGNNNGGNPTQTESALKTIQPALAVRGIACLLCHARVEANIITDFGLGTPSFLGGSSDFTEGQNWYNDIAGAWQSAEFIRGSVFVPDAKVTRNAQNVLGSVYANQPLLNIADFMNVRFDVAFSFYLNEEEAHAKMSDKVIPAAGRAAVVASPRISIRAPSEVEIQNLAPALWSSQSPFGAVRVGDVNPLQLSRVEVGSTGYMTNDEFTVLECSKADIVVRGTLLLRRLKVNAAGGCRLYVSGSVFIEEGITYSGSGSDQNLQITSASSIILGIGLAPLRRRMIDDSRGLEISSRNYAALANQVMQEATTIGNLKDAVNDYSEGPASFEFHGVLFNAPVVHSRYHGLVDGTIIAEAALFSLGNFRFTFDSVFTRVSVLPLLGTPVLTVAPPVE